MSQPSVGPPGILSGLPESYIMQDFSGMKALITDARAILDKLNKNEDKLSSFWVSKEPAKACSWRNGSS